MSLLKAESKKHILGQVFLVHYLLVHYLIETMEDKSHARI